MGPGESVPRDTHSHQQALDVATKLAQDLQGMALECVKHLQEGSTEKKQAIMNSLLQQEQNTVNCSNMTNIWSDLVGFNMDFNIKGCSIKDFAQTIRLALG